MDAKKKEIFVLHETNENKEKRTSIVSEVVLSFLILSGILLFLKDFSYSQWCLVTAFVAGGTVILLYWLTEKNEKAASGMKLVLYIAGIAIFLITITMTVQGFLYLVDCFLEMWNARFGTEAELFAVGSSVGFGSVVMWGLFAVAAVSFMFSQIKKNRIYGLLLLMAPAAAAGLILGQSDMWLAVFLSLAGFFGIFIIYSTRENGFDLRGVVVILAIGVLVGVIGVTTGGYESYRGLENWKQEIAQKFERFRYGEDTLPKGDLQRAAELLDGEEEALKIDINQPQELYLRGFVGGEYDETKWSELPYSAYQGDYEGMLRWLSQNNFSPLSQYSIYERINDEVTGHTTGYIQVTVENTGAYRKYVYLPSVAGAWEKGQDNKDWNVESKSFFGAGKYQFQIPENVSTADSQVPGIWLESPSGSQEENYVRAESVYHSFAMDSYMDVSDELKKKIREKFFSEGKSAEEMNFDELTTQIRRVLRNSIRYSENPEELPSDEDVVSWLMDGGREGNAVAFASAAVMAYRAAGYPARYTEGYHLSSMDAQAASDAGEKELTLTTKNAHAWAEVYISGLGWMPVEVVPGLYVETYTDQLVQGKPSYRVNDTRNNGGTDTTDQGTAGGAAREENISAHTEKHLMIPEILVLCLYGIFILYLILELQRLIRIRKEEKEERNDSQVNWHVAYMEKLRKIGGVKGELTDPKALWKEVEKCFPGIREEEYFRVDELLQKYRFGGIELAPYEIRVLRGLEEHMKQSLYTKKKFPGKLKLRYFYVI